MWEEKLSVDFTSVDRDTASEVLRGKQRPRMFRSIVRPCQK